MKEYIISKNEIYELVLITEATERKDVSMISLYVRSKDNPNVDIDYHVTFARDGTSYNYRFIEPKVHDNIINDNYNIDQLIEILERYFPNIISKLQQEYFGSKI